MSDAHTIPTIQSRQAIAARWRRRSRIVWFWRRVLPLSIFAIVLSLGGWIAARGLLAGPVAAPLEVNAIRMKNPRFYGRDDHDRAYLLAAIEAQRDPREDKRITLESPTFNLGEGRVRADEGSYVEGSDQIVLSGNVVVINSEGDRMETDQAYIDTRTGTVTNAQSARRGRVQIETDMANISADQYEISKNGQVTFHGRVRGVINPN